MALLSFAGQGSRYFYPFDRSIDNPEGLLAVFDILISSLLYGHRPTKRSRTTRFSLRAARFPERANDLNLLVDLYPKNEKQKLRFSFANCTEQPEPFHSLGSEK